MDSTFRSLNTKMIYLQEVRCHRPLGLKKQHELTEHKLGASGLLHPKSPTARRNTERTKLETRCGEAHRACTRTSTPTRTLLSAAPGAPPGTTSGGRSRHTPAASLRTDTSPACFSRVAFREAFSGRRRSLRGVRSNGAVAGRSGSWSSSAAVTARQLERISRKR